MQDQFLRELERSQFVHEPETRAHYLRELERSGLLEALEGELEGHLDRVQRDPPGVTLPFTSKLELPRIASETRELVSAAEAWRLVIAQHHFHSPTASPDGTFALIDRRSGRVRIRLGRGDTNVAEGVRLAENRDADDVARKLEARLALELASTEFSEPMARAWATWARTKARASELEHVRLRPAMYIGDVFERGLHQLVEELLATPLELAARKECTRIDVTLGDDNVVTVDHDGPGIDPAIEPRHEIPRLEAFFTTHGVAFREGPRRYGMTGGLMGVGAWVVNALSEWLNVENRHEGKLYFQAFARGFHKPLEERGATAERGLRVSFKPDPTIFKRSFSRETLRTRLRELSYLNAGLRIAFHDTRTPAQEFTASEGPATLVRELAGEDAILDEPIVFESMALDAENRPLAVRGALVWTSRQCKIVHAFVNNVAAYAGGHIAGLHTGLATGLVAFAKRRRRAPADAEHYRDGLIAVIDMKIAEPEWEGCRKDRIANAEVRSVVQSAVSNAIATFVKSRPREAARVVARGLEAKRRGFVDKSC